MDYTQQSPSLVSFCTGVGGIERGLARAFQTIGWQQPRAVVNVEIEAYLCENLVSGMEQGLLDPALIWTNVKTFPAHLFRGVDIITGGYPCQPFSLAGNRAGTEDTRHLWPYIFNHIRTIRPVFGFFENVAGHLSMGYSEVQQSLRDIGYAVEEGLFTAEEVGAPHRRERLFALAVRADWLGHANSDGNSSGNEFGGSGSNTGQGEGERYQREWVWAKSSPASQEKLAHSISTGQPLPGNDGQPIETSHKGTINTDLEHTSTAGRQQRRRKQPVGTQEPSTQHPSKDRWPARPGQPQYEWEEPRTIERGMGSTINGYNFREDILRSLGNAVVEQTAEFAFIYLLKKHYGI